MALSRGRRERKYFRLEEAASVKITTMHNALDSAPDLKQRDSSELPAVFLSFPFKEKDGWIRHHLPTVLGGWGYRAQMGAHFHGRPISDSVSTTIAKAQLVVCFLMRGNKLASTGWATSDWLLQELGFAKGKGIPAVVIRERGVRASVGLLGDVQLIELDPAAPFLALLPLRRTLRDMLPTPPIKKTLEIRHVARPGAKQNGKQWWDFWAWVDGQSETLDQIDRVSYAFPKPFVPRTEPTSNRAAAFGNYGETDEEFDLQVTLDFKSRPKQKKRHRITLWRLGYE